MADSSKHLITGLDLGSSTIKALVVEEMEDGALRYVASAYAESAGIQGGVIAYPGAAAQAIARACYEIEERLQRHLPNVAVNLGGAQVYGLNARGGCSIIPPHREIGQQDIERAIEAARHHLWQDRYYEVLYEIPRAYMVNGQIGLADPRGMVGYELDVEIHYAVGPSAAIQHLLKSLRLAHLAPAQVVAGPLAAGEALAHTFGMALRGASSHPPHLQSLAVLTIGADTTSIALYVGGAIWMSRTVPVGGAAITEAVAKRLQLPLAAAEELKVRYGQCDLQRVDEFELISLPRTAEQQGWMPRRELVRGIQQGVYALADALCPPLDDARAATIVPQVALLAGGCADLPGLETLLAQALEVPVRRALPGGIVGLPTDVRQPIFATAIGLALWQRHNASYGPRARWRGQRRAFSLPMPNGTHLPPLPHLPHLPSMPHWLHGIKRTVSGGLPS